jgi:CHAT domain-containing protein/tetratricopeptide (TPR) repeat protein
MRRSCTSAALFVAAAVAAPAPSPAGETEAPRLMEQARAAFTRGDSREVRRLVRADRTAAYAAAHRLLHGGDPADAALADHLAHVYAAVHRDPRLLERTDALRRWSPEDRAAAARAREAKEAAIAAFGAGRVDEARRGFEEALAAFQRLGDLREEGRCLSNLGAVAASTGDSSEALRLLDEARAVLDRSGDLDLLPAIHINRAYALDDLGRQEEGRAALEEAAAAAREAGDRAGAGRALQMIGAFDMERGRLDAAEEATRRAVAEGRAMDDPDLVGAASFNLARLLRMRGDLAGEERALRQSLEAARRGGFAGAEAEALLELAAAARRRGDLEAARASLLRAREAASRTEDDAIRANVEHDEAALRVAEGRYAEALPFLDAAEALLKGTEFLGKLSAAHGTRATALYYMGAYEAAIAQLKLALEKASSGGRLDLEAGHRASLGHLLALLGDPRAGLAELEEAARIHQELGDQVAWGTDMDAIGTLRFRAGDHAGARAALEQAIAALPGESARLERAEALKDLAEVELASGPAGREAALALLREARGELAAAGDLEGGVHADLLLARAALAAGDAGGARAALDRMRAAMGGRRTVQHAWLIRETEGLLLEARGDGAGALREHRRAVEEVERLRAGLLPDAWRAAVLEDRISPYRALVRIHLRRGEIEEAWQAARAAKARTLVERMVPPSFEEDAAERSASRAPAAHAPPASLLPARVLPSDRLRALLAEDEILLDFFRGDEGWGVFALSRRGLAHRSLTSPPASLEAPLESARHPGRPGADGDEAAVAAWREACRRLGGMLLGPAEDLLHEAREILIVPGGALHGLPWPALEVGGGPLVERWTVSVLPAAESLASRAAEPPGGLATMLAVGDPAPPSAVEGGPAGGPDVPAGAAGPGSTPGSAGPASSPPSVAAARLPGAAAEAQAAAALAPGPAIVLVGGKAREAEVRRRAPAADRIHIAAHGRLDRLSPARSHIALAPGGGEDGRWEAAEIAAQRLRASLVVLSGCETGVELGLVKGEPPGDERIGLARAFLAAGAGTVIAGLWEVDDGASSVVMPQLYPKLVSGSPARALARLQRDLRAGKVRGAGGRALDHPFYWAGLVAYGAGAGRGGVSPEVAEVRETGPSPAPSPPPR